MISRTVLEKMKGINDADLPPKFKYDSKQAVMPRLVGACSQIHDT